MTINIVKSIDFFKFNTWSASFYTTEGFLDIGHKTPHEIKKITEEKINDAHEKILIECLKSSGTTNYRIKDFDINRITNKTDKLKLHKIFKNKKLPDDNNNETLKLAIITYTMIDCFENDIFDDKIISEVNNKISELEKELKILKSFINK